MKASVSILVVKAFVAMLIGLAFACLTESSSDGIWSYWKGYVCGSFGILVAEFSIKDTSSQSVK